MISCTKNFFLIFTEQNLQPTYRGVDVLKDTLIRFCPLLVKENQENFGITNVCENFFTVSVSSVNIFTHASTNVMATQEKNKQANTEKGCNTSVAM